MNRIRRLLITYLIAACIVALVLIVGGCSVRDYGFYPPIIFPNAGH